MTADEFTAALTSRSVDPEEWLSRWSEHLAAVEPYIYRHPGGGWATFKPSELTADLLSELVGRADLDGFAEVPFADLARSLDVEDPATLAPHMRALRCLGAVERFSRPGACNRYRLALERAPDGSLSIA